MICKEIFLCCVDEGLFLFWLFFFGVFFFFNFKSKYCEIKMDLILKYICFESLLILLKFKLLL